MLNGKARSTKTAIWREYLKYKNAYERLYRTSASVFYNNGLRTGFFAGIMFTLLLLWIGS